LYLQLPGCWIGGHWLADELIGQYVWFWIAAFIDIFLYVPLYFCLRMSFHHLSVSPLFISNHAYLAGGNIDYDPIKRKIRIGRAENVEPVMQTKAGKLLWYVFFSHDSYDQYANTQRQVSDNILVPSRTPLRNPIHPL
jgi:hypothetical protein